MSDSDDKSEDEVVYDSDYDMEEDDLLYDKYVDHDIDFGDITEQGSKEEVYVSFNSGVTKALYAKLQSMNEDYDEDSDELASIDGSDEEGNERIKYPRFNQKKHGSNPQLEIGLIFSSKREAKDAITSYCLKRGMQFRFIFNDKRRLTAKCPNENCSWYVHVSPMHGQECWQMKTFRPNHANCSWNYNNKSITASWVGKTFMKKLKTNPSMPATVFRTEVCTKLKVNISLQQAYKAKNIALQMLEGDVREQYSRVRDYCEELLRSNPGSTVVLKLTGLEVDGAQPIFERLYICLDACKKGLKACRNVIGVDGCFLKGRHGGQLLTAVGIDPDNNIFPIAYAVVEGETKDSWEWFLNLLDADVGITKNQLAWTFMSDKQKGLIPAFETLFPDAENRFCVQHLHSNMKKDGFLGLSIKNALWAAAKATRIEEFNVRMEELKKLDKKAYEWLVKKPPNQWSRSHFSPFPRCDILTNNMCESFNSLILPARDKHLITMLETIRNILMTRMQVNRDKAKKWVGKLCPRIQKILEKNMALAGECIPMKSDDFHYQIVGPHDQHNVDLTLNSCTCKRWDLTGIPCKHAISAIWSQKKNPTDYVHHLYEVQSYIYAYVHPIFGINGMDLWPLSNLPPPCPPPILKKPGRPKKLRRRHPLEPPASSTVEKLPTSSQRSVKCKKCGKLGHNMRTCKASVLQQSQNDEGEASNATVNTPQDVTGVEMHGRGGGDKGKGKQVSSSGKKRKG